MVSRVWLACVVEQRYAALRQTGSRVLGYRTAKGSAAAGALVSQSPTQGETRRGNGGSMVGARLRRWRAATAEGRCTAGPGTAHRQRERRRLGPVALVREAARSMELRAVEESRVDEDDMRAVTCGGEESDEEEDFF